MEGQTGKNASGSGQLMIDHFKVIRKLAQGGMGVVYLAYEENLDRHVALKFLSLDLCRDPRIVERFDREAKAAAGLQHPNIVAIYFRGKAGGRPYFAMELIEGQSLDERIKKGPIRAAEAVNLLIQACGGLSAAWEKGKIHRDIKPANLMLSGDGILKITDFGLAKALDSDANLTSANMVVGTPNFISPEQAEGKPVDCRSDIYSLGATFYYLLSGTLPFTGNSAMGILVKHIHEPLVPLQKRMASVPPALCSIIERMMEKDPADRYQDYKELTADLKAIERSLDADPAVTAHNVLASPRGDRSMSATSGADEGVPGPPAANGPSSGRVQSARLSRAEIESGETIISSPRPRAQDGTLRVKSPNTRPRIAQPQKEKKRVLPRTLMISAGLLAILVITLMSGLPGRIFAPPRIKPLSLRTFLGIRSECSYLLVRALSQPEIVRTEINAEFPDFFNSWDWCDDVFGPEMAESLAGIARLTRISEKDDPAAYTRVVLCEKSLLRFRIEHPCRPSIVEAMRCSLLNILKEKEPRVPPLLLKGERYEDIRRMITDRPPYEDQLFAENDLIHFYERFISCFRLLGLAGIDFMQDFNDSLKRQADRSRLEKWRLIEMGAGRLWGACAVLLTRDPEKWDPPVKIFADSDSDGTKLLRGFFDALAHDDIEESATALSNLFELVYDRDSSLLPCPPSKPSPGEFTDYLAGSISCDKSDSSFLEKMDAERYVALWSIFTPRPKVIRFDFLPPPASEETVNAAITRIIDEEFSPPSHGMARGLLELTCSLCRLPGSRKRIKSNDRAAAAGVQRLLIFQTPAAPGTISKRMLKLAFRIIRAARVNIEKLLPLLHELAEHEDSYIGFLCHHPPCPDTAEALVDVLEDRVSDPGPIEGWRVDELSRIPLKPPGPMERKNIESILLSYMLSVHVMRLARIDAWEIEDDFLKKRRTIMKEKKADEWQTVEKAFSNLFLSLLKLLKQRKRKVLGTLFAPRFLDEHKNLFLSLMAQDTQRALQSLARLIRFVRHKAARLDVDLPLLPQLPNSARDDEDERFRYFENFPQQEDDRLGDFSYLIVSDIETLLLPPAKPPHGAGSGPGAPPPSGRASHGPSSPGGDEDSPGTGIRHSIPEYGPDDSRRRRREFRRQRRRDRFARRREFIKQHPGRASRRPARRDRKRPPPRR